MRALTTDTRLTYLEGYGSLARPGAFSNVNNLVFQESKFAPLREETYV